MNLEQTQMEFSRCLLQTGISPEINITGPAPAEQLLQLYRNNFVIGLTEMLEAVFPVTEALVGGEFFAQLCKSYIQQCPLQQANIEQYGEGLPGFIRQSTQTASLPYLADISQLEWNLEQAKSCTEKTSFPFEKLALVSQEEQTKIQFKITEHASLMRSDHPVFSIWNAVHKNNFDNLNMSQAEFLIVVPRLSEGAELMPLTEQEYHLLDQLRNNKPMSELPPTDNFEELLLGWISAGIVDDFNLTTEECSP